MGCVSSKIITKSASFRDDWSRLSFRRKGDGVDELILSKNGGEQLVALLCTANSVARRLKEGSTPAHEQPDENKDSSLEYSTEEAADKNQNGIEDQGSMTMSISPSRRFRTIEDFDAMLAAKQRSSGGSQSSVEARVDDNIKCELDKVEPEAKSRGGDDERPGSRRKAMAKELAALSVPSSSSSFEFSRAGSRLLLGGQAPSPGSYVTPKFGNFDDATQRAKDEVAVFDPELIAHFEQAMEQLTMEEDRILEKIIEGLEEFSEEENSGIGTSHVSIH